MLSIQEISDRLEIQDLLVRYSYAIDDRNWDALDSVFTPDARIDYLEAGGISSTLDEVKRWLPESLRRLPSMQHLVATTELKLDGDHARSRTMLFNPINFERQDGSSDTYFTGLWYHDSLVRTGDGWRISERRLQLAYTYNSPAPDTRLGRCQS